MSDEASVLQRTFPEDEDHDWPESKRDPGEEVRKTPDIDGHIGVELIVRI